MADIFRKPRPELESRFETGDIPEARHFIELIHSSFNQKDDGIRKEAGTPLEIQAPDNIPTAPLKDFIQFYESFGPPDAPVSTPDWRISLANLEPPFGGDEISGLAITDNNRETDVRLFIRDGGNVGIGTTNPTNKLEVNGSLKAATLTGLILPRPGKESDKGVLFPNVSSGGVDHTAYIRYYPQAGQAGQPAGTVLELNVSNAAQDHIALMPSGHVGINTLTPPNTLFVDGDIGLSKDIFIPGDRQIRFKDTNVDNNLKIELRSGYGLGAKTGELFYTAAGKHAWKDLNGANTRMTLTTGANGGLEVLGDGLSSFAGDLLVKKTLTVSQIVSAESFSGLIRPTLGNADNQGILFNPGAGSDKAQIRYFSPSGGSDRNLEIKVSGDNADHIVLKTAGGNVRIETANPNAQLNVEGNIQVSGQILVPGTQKIHFTGTDFSSNLKIELPGGVGLGAESNTLFYSGHTHFWKDAGSGHEGMRLNTTAGGALEVKGSGRSSFAGSLDIRQNLRVTGDAQARSFDGLIKPTAGNKASEGIQFPEDPVNLGYGDRAWIQYYSRSGTGQDMTLEIGIENNSNDHIVLKPSGNVGVDVDVPTSKLDVGGRIKATSLQSSGTVSASAFSIDGVSIGKDELLVLRSLARGKAYVGVRFGFNLLFSYHFDSASHVIIPR